MGGSGLSERQGRVLAAICETLIPSIDESDDPEGFFSHTADAAAIERVERLIGAIRDPRDQLRLRLLLSVFSLPPVNLILSGQWGGLASFSRDRRETVLRSWAFSANPLRRAGFQALKRLIQVGYYAWPSDERGHPAWRHVGRQGPLPQPDVGVEPLQTIEVSQDLSLECDVVIVGSGAGGGVVAGVLAEAGWDVVVLEKGPNPGARDMTQIEGDMLQSLYLDGGLLMTQSGSMPVLAGSCVGGGTTINYTTSFPLPQAVREEWKRASGLDLFTSDRFDASLNRVTERLGAGTRWATPGRRDRILEEGCRALEWHVDTMPRNVTDCLEGVECGFCGYGCRHGKKNTITERYLRGAVANGARVIADCEVEQVTLDGRRATGVEAQVGGSDGKHRLTVRARTVVVAAGTIYTPAVLARSGVRHAALGKGLRLHPATAVLGVFPDRVDPWSGSLQTRYSDQFADQDAGFGTKFETAPAHFALVASAYGWQSSRQMKADIGRLGYTSLVGILLRDRDAGRVAVGRDGHPRVHYELSRYDVGHVRTGIRGAARLLAEVGAIEIFSLQTPPTRIRPNSQGWLDRFMDGVDRTGYRRCRMSYITFHQMGTAAMGADPARSVVNGSGAAHGFDGLYVTDGSVFPMSSGVNPMITIMAIADHVARAMLGE